MLNRILFSSDQLVATREVRHELGGREIDDPAKTGDEMQSRGINAEESEVGKIDKLRRCRMGVEISATEARRLMRHPPALRRPAD